MDKRKRGKGIFRRIYKVIEVFVVFCCINKKREMVFLDCNKGVKRSLKI